MEAAMKYNMNPEYLQEIPGTTTLVSIYRLRDLEGNLVTGLTGFDELRLARSLKCNVVTSKDWHLSMRYFQENPEQAFCGRLGRDIFEEYTASESRQRTSTFLTFRDPETGEFPENTRDVLKVWKINGNIALVDSPYADTSKDILVPSVKTKVVDITSRFQIENGMIDGGFIQDYDEELGIPTAFGIQPNPKYKNAQMSKIKAKGTHQLVRGYSSTLALAGEWAYEGMFSVRTYEPSFRSSDISIRLSQMKMSTNSTRIY